MPLFKNWPEICKLAENHYLLMMEIATLDLEKDDPVTRQLLTAFPACFSNKQVMGPVPMSMIREKARENGARIKRYEDYVVERPVFFEAVPNFIPVQAFQGPGGSNAGLYDAPILPDNININVVQQGDTVTWNGRDFIVLENNDGCNELFIAPVECIAVDL